MKILVTGGAGYIGSHTCVELLNNGYDVIVYDNLSNSCEKSLERVKEITGKTVKFIKGDILDKVHLDEVFTENQIDCVINFAGLKAVNPDVIAWIQIPALDISYPVVQGKDNAYYLHHLFSGESNINGSIFVDCHNQPDFTDQNTIVYGHNMKNGTMFSELLRYEDKYFAKNYPYITFADKDGENVYQIIAAFYTQIYTEDDIAFKYYDYFGELDSEQMARYLNNIEQIALYYDDVAVTAEDKLLTLSTCAYQIEDGRFVVVAKKIDKSV